jgi:predicted dehydrogenase
MSKRTRRQFLEDSMFAAASAVTAGSASRLLAAGSKQSSDPVEKLGVAVVGVRGRGGSHIGAFAGRKDTEVLYICDVDTDVGERRVRETTKRQRRAPKFEADIRKVLEDHRVDVVSIATPNHWHALGAIWSIQAGKDVYLEKPISHNVSEGRRIVEAARKYKRICQTGTQCRSNPGMMAAMSYVRDGKIGKVEVARGLCHTRRGSIGPRGIYEPPASVNYDLWLGPARVVPVTRPRFHYDWHWQWSFGNGDLGNQGIHQMDVARWGLGVNKLSRGVISFGGRYGRGDAVETANTQVVIHDYDDASLVLEVRGLKKGSYKAAKIGVIFEGTEGYVVMTSYTSGAGFDPDGNKVREFSGGANHFENFLRAVRSRRISDLTADIEEGHLSSALCHMGNVSYRLGDLVSASELKERLSSVRLSGKGQRALEQTLRHAVNKDVGAGGLKFCVGPFVAFDPETETFLDSEQANELLSRDYRKPFVVPAAGEV